MCSRRSKSPVDRILGREEVSPASHSELAERLNGVEFFLVVRDESRADAVDASGYEKIADDALFLLAGKLWRFAFTRGLETPKQRIEHPGPREPIIARRPRGWLLVHMDPHLTPRFHFATLLTVLPCLT